MGRFVVLAACVVLSLVGGLQYIFGTISPELKEVFRLEQPIVDAAGLAQNFGGNVGLHAGIFLDAFGPRPMILSAAVLGGTSYLVLYLALTQTWDIHGNAFVLYLIMFAIGQAQLLVDMSIVPTVSRLFQENRGLTLGLCKAFLGLGGSLVVQLYTTFLMPDIEGFILFLSVYFFAICVCSSFFVSSNEKLLITDEECVLRTEETKRATKFALKGVVLLMTLLMVALFSKSELHVSGLTQLFLTVLIVTVFVGICFSIALTPEHAVQGVEDPLALRTNLSNHMGTTASSSTTAEILDASELSVPLLVETPEKKLDKSLYDAVHGLDFWCHAGCVCTAWGSGLYLIMNVGQLVEIVGSPAENKDIVVSLISIFNCMGRLTIGAASDALQLRGIKRTQLFGWFVLLTGGVMLLLKQATPSTFFFSAVILGYAYGALNVLSPAIVVDLYGTKHIGSLYAAMMLFVTSGTYLIASRLFASVYEAHVKMDKNHREHCFGPSCIAVSTTACALLCIITGTLYLFRFRKV